VSDDRKRVRVKAFRLTSNLGNVRTVTVYADFNGGKNGVTTHIDRLEPGEEVEISVDMIERAFLRMDLS
jgi:hypothetical protein